MADFFNRIDPLQTVDDPEMLARTLSTDYGNDVHLQFSYQQPIQAVDKATAP
jgi:hypothetical protein